MDTSPAGTETGAAGRARAARRASLSVILITRDEEERVERALESVRWADEIIVVDSGSTDSTEQIVRGYTDRFFVEPWEGYGRQKQRALERATGEWVLSIDADEVVGGELRRSLQRLLLEPWTPERPAGYEVEFTTRMLGRWFGTRGWYAERRLRVFRREQARFATFLVHESVEVDGEVARLPGRLHHYHDRGLRYELDRVNRYSTLSAQQMHREGRGAGSLVASLVRGPAYFLQRYLLQGGFLYGRAGLVDAALRGTYGFFKYAKLWDLQRREGEPPAPAPPDGAERGG